MTIVVPAELVPFLRDGLYFDLHGLLERTSSLIEPRGRAADVRLEVTQALARAEGTRALLDVVGWTQPAELYPVKVHEPCHRAALLRGLRERLASERDAEEDGEADAGERSQARSRAVELAALTRRVEDADLGPDVRHAQEGTEALILQALLTRREGRTREELRSAVLSDVAPCAVDRALCGLLAERAVCVDGERVRVSACARHVNHLVGVFTERGEGR